MGNDETDSLASRHVSRITGQTDKLVAAGRLTAEEAERLRAASDVSVAEQVVRDIRERHVSERLEVSMAEGAMSRQEADDILERVRDGEHSRALRSHLARFRVGHRKQAKLADPRNRVDNGQERPA